MPPQTDQKYVAAVLDLGNIAELSVPFTTAPTSSKATWP
jgi:hypothetical protein